MDGKHDGKTKHETIEGAKKLRESLGEKKNRTTQKYRNKKKNQKKKNNNSNNKNSKHGSRNYDRCPILTLLPTNRTPKQHTCESKNQKK